ncbi:MAG: DUF1127 domain-containing protein [Proteobacteria bacterium]|nr:DUF1127 domain-containing protein [Pseudomonadota bacterium]
MSFTSYAHNASPVLNAHAMMRATGTEFRTVAVSVLSRMHRKWTNRRAQTEFASLNDHTLREIGIHRSEMTVVTEEGIGPTGARFYR